jgi:hypothetical protein
MKMPAKPPTALETPLRRVMDRLRLTDASPELQIALAQTFASEPGRTALGWILSELSRRTYAPGGPWDLAICWGARAEFADQLRDLIARGQSALDQSAERRIAEMGKPLSRDYERDRREREHDDA